MTKSEHARSELGTIKTHWNLILYFLEMPRRCSRPGEFDEVPPETSGVFGTVLPEYNETANRIQNEIPLGARKMIVISWRCPGGAP